MSERNAPYVFGIRSAACALAAGNTTILKSSEQTPRCYWAIVQALHEAGLPAGCLNLISCRPQDAPEVVNTMIEHPAMRKVNFTGSTVVGRKIARACGENLKPCLMELGGKNSAIVCADANIETAVKGVLAGALLNVRTLYFHAVSTTCTDRLVRPNLHVNRPHPRPRRHRPNLHGRPQNRPNHIRRSRLPTPNPRQPSLQNPCRKAHHKRARLRRLPPQRLSRNPPIGLLRAHATGHPGRC